ncbi:hypothetical protein [Slackia exigua]
MLRRLRGLEGSGLDDSGLDGSGLDGSGLDGSDLDGPGLDGSTWRAVFVEERDRAFSIVARQQLWINPVDAKARGITHGECVGRHLAPSLTSMRSMDWKHWQPWIGSSHGLEALAIMDSETLMNVLC